MSNDAKDVLERALKPPIEARAAIAGSLISSLDGPVDEDVEAAWEMEIAKRLANLYSGIVEAIPWSEARHRILGR
jgi:hypothetical protein